MLPGFRLAFGYTIVYLSLIVLLPLAAAVWKAASLDWHDYWAAVSHPRTVAAYWLSFYAALTAAAINLAFGLLAAWVLARYTFPGRKVLDALIDLPFALPTAVAGITLTTLYAPKGWLGRLLQPLGIDVAYTPLGIIVALTFIGLPFVVRTVQPLLQEFDREVEEAATILGAGRWHVFSRVLLPGLLPALITGFTLAFARALGEYGSVVFIAGNMPGRTEIAPLVILMKLEQFDYASATAIAVTMLAASFVLLVLTNVLQWWSSRHA